VVAVVATLRVLGEAAVPAIVTDDGPREQVGTEVPVVGVTAQVRLTAPVKPPLGVTEMALVPDAPATTVILAPLIAMAGVTAWVIATVTNVLALANAAPVAGGA
jgi:hypothetical protein